MHYKFILIAACGAFTAAALGYFFSDFALTNSYASLITASICALMYLALFSLRMLITPRARIAILWIIVDLLLFTASFFNHFSLWLGIAAIIAGAWLFLAWHRGRAAMMNMVRIRLRDLGTSFIKPSLHAIMFLCIASYLSLINPAQFALSRDVIASLTQKTTQQFGNIFIQDSIGKPVTPEMNAQILERATNTIHAMTEKIITRIPPRFKSAALVGLGIIIFLVLGSTTSIFIPVINSIVWFFITLLLRAHFITIKTETTEKETIIAA